MNAAEVLMVDDNEGDVLLMREAIEKAGLRYQLAVVDDGTTAVDYLRRCAQAARWPDMILLDLKLPRKNGLEVLEIVRADPALAQIPLAVLSSSRSDLEAAKAQGLPAEYFRVKPGLFQDYVALVQDIERYRIEQSSAKTQGEA